jgi:hypothetical protein
METEFSMYSEGAYKIPNFQERNIALKKILVGYINTSHINGRPVASAEISKENGNVHITTVYPILTGKALECPEPQNPSPSYRKVNKELKKVRVFVDYDHYTWDNLKKIIGEDHNVYKRKFESALSKIINNSHEDSLVVSLEDRNLEIFNDFSTFVNCNS